MKGFREFLTRGSLVELAVAVVIGTAFTAGKAAAHMSLGSGRGLAVPSPDARGKG